MPRTRCEACRSGASTRPSCRTPTTTTSSRCWSATGSTRCVDDWTSSEEAESCKPDRRIYEVALAKAGSTPAETLFVGDSLQHDVAGARAVGMRTVLIGEPGTKAPLSTGLDAPEPADFEVRRLAEVLTIVDEANGAG